MLTAKNQDQLQNPMLGNRVWAAFCLLAVSSGITNYIYYDSHPAEDRSINVGLSAIVLPFIWPTIAIGLPSVLWHCWLVARKSIQPIKIEWWGVGVVICLERGADCLHMVPDATAIPKPQSSLASFKSGLVYLSGTSQTRLHWKRGC